MKKILDFIQKYNIIYLFFLFLTGIYFFKIFGNNIYSPYSDIGRELYINSQLIKGEVLYKDIFNVYAPLGYLINAFITLIFSDKLIVFKLTGLFITIINLIAIFLISKKFMNRFAAFSVSIMIIPTCAFFPSISNWILPYSYSVLYAFCGILWSLYFLLNYAQERNSRLLLISCFFYGFSISCKYEYILFIVIISGVIIYSKPTLKVICKSVGCIFFCPIFCILILIIQGCGISDLTSAVNYMVSLLKSESAKYFYNYNGFKLSEASVKNALNSAYCDYYYIIENIRRYGTQTPLYNLQPNSVSFRMTGYISIILSFIVWIYFYIKRTNISKEAISILILASSSILLSVKVIGSISFEIYGTYFFPIILIFILSLLYKSKLANIFNRIIILLLLTISIFYFLDNTKNTKEYNFKQILTEKGEIAIPNTFYDNTVELIKCLESKNSFLIIPEGSIINYLTNKNSNNKLYYLIPPNVEIFGSDKIIKKIKEENIEYIIISNIMYKDYNQTSFSNSWGKEIYNYIKNNYILEKTIGTDLKFLIYKNPNIVTTEYICHIIN